MNNLKFKIKLIFVALLAISIAFAGCNKGNLDNSIGDSSEKPGMELSSEFESESISSEVEMSETEYFSDSSEYSESSEFESESYIAESDLPTPALTPKPSINLTPKPSITLSPSATPGAYSVYHVTGVVGDGITDDGPAIQAAISQATNTGGNATIIFPANKKFYLGHKPNTYAYFTIENINNFTIEGNGSELVLNRKNSAFKIKDCENFEIKGLNIDYEEVPYSQGKVINRDSQSNSIVVEIDEGFALPPDHNFVSAQGWPWYSGAGLHGLIFNDTIDGANAVRKYTPDAPRHFTSSLVEKVGNSEDRLYRFTISNVNMFNKIDVGDKITHGWMHIYLTRHEYNSKLTTGYSEVVSISRSSNVTLENINIYTGLGMGIRIADNDGKITLRRTNIRVKPGTNRLLSTPSDGIHTKNNRVGITIDDCLIESTGDDNLNISTMFDYIYEMESNTKLKIKTVDVWIYFYRPKKNDLLTFFDLSKNTILGEATIINDPVYDEFNKFTTVELSNPINGIYAGPNLPSNPIRILNNNQRAKDTIIKNSTFRPVFRNSLFGAFNGGNIINNKFDGTRGGVMGLNFSGDADVFSGSAHVLAYSNDINIIENEFHNYQWHTIIQRSTPIKSSDGHYLTRNINISNNYFKTNYNDILMLENIHNLSGDNNLISTTVSPNRRIRVINCTGTVNFIE